MNDQQEPKIIVDSDWKKEAQEEKVRLDAETKDVGRHADLPEPSMAEIINTFVMNATIGLYGYEPPGGPAIPPDLPRAKHYIDLLEVLREKTKGNLTSEEEEVFDAVLHNLRMNFVAIAQRPPGDRQSEAADMSPPQ